MVKQSYNGKKYTSNDRISFYYFVAEVERNDPVRHKLCNVKFFYLSVRYEWR